MGHQPSRSVEGKVRIVLAVLRGEISIAAAARREGTSGVSVSKWRDLFLAGAQRALEAGARGGLSGRERQLAGEIEELNRALGEAHMELRLWKRGAHCTQLRRSRGGTGQGRRDGHDVLRGDRRSPGDVVSVAGRFQLVDGPVVHAGPRHSRGGREGAGGGLARWGHRKLAELKRFGIDDVEAGPVSDSTMYRVLARNGLCLPAKDTGDVRQAAGARREAFICPPARRNRLWQADFSEYETAAGGTWNLGGVVD